MNEKIITALIGVLTLFAIPYVTTNVFVRRDMERKENIASMKTGMNVCIMERGEYELIDVEEYVVYALAGKADLSWNDEMLKTMAVVLRTSIYYEMQHQRADDKNNDLIYEEDLYEIRYEENELKERYGNKYSTLMNRVYDAVLQTSEQVITYGGETIMPAYHSTSIGHTVSAKELYGVDIPYLQSVDSSMDVEAEDFTETKLYSKTRIKKEFEDKSFLEMWDAQAAENTGTTSEEEYPKDEFKIAEATESGFAKKINVFGKMVDAGSFCKIFGLASTNVHIDKVDGQFRIIAIGNGSSIGLSLFGAEVLSKKGMTYEEIINYYYTNVEIMRQQSH